MRHGYPLLTANRAHRNFDTTPYAWAYGRWTPVPVIVLALRVRRAFPRSFIVSDPGTEG